MLGAVLECALYIYTASTCQMNTKRFIFIKYLKGDEFSQKIKFLVHSNHKILTCEDLFLQMAIFIFWQFSQKSNCKIVYYFCQKKKKISDEKDFLSS